MMKFIAFVALVVSSATPCFGDNPAGQLIDEMMKKNSSVVTAEDALPSKTKSVDKSTSKGPDSEASQPVFSNPSISPMASGSPKNLWGRMFLSLAIALGVFACGVLVYRRLRGPRKISPRTKND